MLKQNHIIESYIPGKEKEEERGWKVTFKSENVTSPTSMRSSSPLSQELTVIA